MSLYVYGAGGFGRETAMCARTLGIEVAAFVDDSVAGEVMGLPVITQNDLPHGAQLVIAIADPATRRRIAESLTPRGVRWTSVVDASTTWLESCTIGEGAIILPHVHVSVSAIVGEHVHVNYGATIGHDTRIGGFSVILPGANVAGSVHIGTGVTVGSGAVILQGLHIGDGAMIGAGAVVTRDVPSSTTVVGVPARPVQR